MSGADFKVENVIEPVGVFSGSDDFSSREMLNSFCICLLMSESEGGEVFVDKALREAFASFLQSGEGIAGFVQTNLGDGEFIIGLVEVFVQEDL